MARQLSSIKEKLKVLISKSRLLSRATGRIYFGLNDLDRKLIEYLDFSNGYFVELGANDGLLQSNTKHLELFKNWRGVLIEPIPDLAKKCSNRRKSITINAACVSFDFEGTELGMAYSGLMSTALDRGNDLPDPMAHAEMGAKYLAKGEEVGVLKVPARTLNCILIETNSPNFLDLLSLDVEGYELEVLKGLDFNKFRFKWMLIETRDIHSLESFLKLRNYEVHAKLTHHDYLFKKVESLG